MSIEVGTRVRVKKPTDADRVTGNGYPVDRYTGLRGEVVQVGSGPHAQADPATIHKNHSVGDAATVRFSKDASATCPDEGMVLVDSQFVNGQPQGSVGIRDWFYLDDLEVG